MNAANLIKGNQLAEFCNKYTPLLEVMQKFDRRAVSWQLSKKNPYKEGFSAELVNIAKCAGLIQSVTT